MTFMVYQWVDLRTMWQGRWRLVEPLEVRVVGAVGAGCCQGPGGWRLHSLRGIYPSRWLCICQAWISSLVGEENIKFDKRRKDRSEETLLVCVFLAIRPHALIELVFLLF